MRTQRSAKAFSIVPPIEPMLAKLADALPATGTFLFEPKWDGFRAIIFRGASGVFIQSRDLRPPDRYFPEPHEALLERLAARRGGGGGRRGRGGWRSARAPAWTASSRSRRRVRTSPASGR